MITVRRSWIYHETVLWWLLLSHACGVLLAALAGWRRGIRAGLAIAAAAPLAMTIWAVDRLVSGAEPETTEMVWVGGLDLVLRFRTDALALLMTVLVSGIGVLVFAFATAYFNADAAGPARFPATLLAFSASMLGLVLADSIWTLFIFWELTSITSFLLVGYKSTSLTVTDAARRALMITTGGGLVLLVGLLVLADASGSTTLSEFTRIDDTAVSVAAALVMIGAATKSAQLPFHVWLPGAMAAPTPVSAYLHSATMVKAGVFLVAVLGPVFTGNDVWMALGLAFGVSSMLWGAIGALRHDDTKLILAWSTVSQLGLLITLLSIGTAKGVFAAMSLLLAHALFKAALFIVVGEVDVRTGIRSITELGGLAEKMPVAAVVAVAAGASMAGVPPLLGFAAKEAAIEAVLELDGSLFAVAGVSVIVGAVLTVAYTTRFLIGLLGPGPEVDVAPSRPFLALPSVVLAGAGLLGYVFIDQFGSLVVPAAVELDAEADVYAPLRWPGFTLGLAVSAAVVVVGGALGVTVARRTMAVPTPHGAAITDRYLDGIPRACRRIIGRIQHGSLPIYLVTMAGVASLAALPMALQLSPGDFELWSDPFQALLAASIVAAAVAGGFVGSRLGAALTLGAVGICVSGVYILHGAPDLALTQLLVETVIVVGFVLGLGHLARSFPDKTDAWQAVRIVVSLAVGIGVPSALAVASTQPTGRPPIDDLVRLADEEGGGTNVVNVILTDIRALDTLGEITVLVVVALGIVALANVRRSEVSA